jgi:deoxyribodipyrimidine photo-lyase
MNISEFHKSNQIRFRNLNEENVNDEGTAVYYIMQRSLRTDWNLSLELAISHADELGCGVVVACPFTRSDHMPTWRQGHYVYQLISDLKKNLHQRGIKFVFLFEGFQKACERLASNAKAIYTEKAYLRGNRQDREQVARTIDLPLIEVEDNVISPVERTSDKEEYAARTIRGKIDFSLAMDEVEMQQPKVSSLWYSIKGEDLIDVDKALKRAGFDQDSSVISHLYTQSEKEAQKQVNTWLEDDYYNYNDFRSDPNRDSASHLSVALHFGLVSPHHIASEMKLNRGKNKEAFLEELIVRRELAFNFVYFNRQHYDSFQCLPGWAQDTLEAHKSDKRNAFSKKELLEGKTDDEVWNHCMRKIVEQGYLHNHLRMYWGKKILEYTNTPSFAYQMALEFNNTYFMDGNDPNSFANVAWIFGKHDRAFGESDVFGKVRPMSRNGLDRKFDVDEWLEA